MFPGTLQITFFKTGNNIDNVSRNVSKNVPGKNTNNNVSTNVTDPETLPMRFTEKKKKSTDNVSLKRYLCFSLNVNYYS